MIIPKKPLHRRTVLRAAGVGVGLPLLEAMVPFGKTAFAQSQQPNRFMACFTSAGMHPPNFFPNNYGKVDQLPNTLEPLAGHKNDILILDNVWARHADPEITGMNDGGAHGPATGAFLTGHRPVAGETRLNVSVDQVMANYLDGQTPIHSLQMAVDKPHAGPGADCDAGFGCAFMYHVSWNAQGNYLPNQTDPVQLWNQLFGRVEGGVGGGSVRNAIELSILDSVLGDISKLKTKLGASDKEKLDEYLASVRGVEAELNADSGSAAACDLGPSPGKVTGSGGRRAQKIIDLHAQLTVLAFQCDLTRVATLMFDRGASTRKYDDIWSNHNETHHSYSHHGNNPGKKSRLAQIERWELERYAKILDLMKSTTDASGKSLLESSTVYLGNEINDGEIHRYQRMPVVIAGSANGKMKTGEYLRLPNNRRDVCDLFETFLDFMGHTGHGRFGDFGTGKVSQIMT